MVRRGKSASKNPLDVVKGRFEGSGSISYEGIIPKIHEYIRVLKFARKPTKEEFYAISKVAAVGIVVIGIIGFVIYLLLTVLPTYG
ncbi:MAG: protein translocase SEC61 complex subunit gamma [Methermicoccaceae archaeon]